MLTPLRSNSLVRRKFKMGANAVGSLSMKIAPVSSRSVDILPLSKLEKKESGIHVKVCLDVLNLVPPTFSWMMSPIPDVELFPVPAILSKSLRSARRKTGGLKIQIVHGSSWSPRDSPYSSSRPCEPINYASRAKQVRWGCSYTVFSIFRALINYLKHGLRLSKAPFCSLADWGSLCSVLWAP